MFEINRLTVGSQDEIALDTGFEVLLDIPFKEIVADRARFIEGRYQRRDDAFELKQCYPSILSRNRAKPGRLSSRPRNSGKSLNWISRERSPDRAPRIAR